MGFFAMMFLFFVISRMMHGRRHHFTRLHCYGQQRYRQFPVWHAPAGAPVTEAPKPNVYEQLKTRYVRGEIDVERYERELDEMLRSPEGRKFVN